MATKASNVPLFSCILLLPILSVVDCNTYPEVEHTTVSGGTTVGHVATYTCNVGYVLEGDPTILCLSNGSWTAGRPICGKDFILHVLTFATH